MDSPLKVALAAAAQKDYLRGGEYYKNFRGQHSQQVKGISNEDRKKWHGGIRNKAKELLQQHESGKVPEGAEDKSNQAYKHGVAYMKRMRGKMDRKTKIANRMGGKEEEYDDDDEYDEDGNWVNPNNTKADKDLIENDARMNPMERKAHVSAQFDFWKSRGMVAKGADDNVRKSLEQNYAAALEEARARQLKYNQRTQKLNRMGKHSKKHTTPTENLKNKKRKNKLGNSAIFSGADTINFTNNNNGTETVKAMGASAEDIKTAYGKVMLNA